MEGWNVQHLGVGKKAMKHVLWGIARAYEGSLVCDGREHRGRKDRPE